MFPPGTFAPLQLNSGSIFLAIWLNCWLFGALTYSLANTFPAGIRGVRINGLGLVVLGIGFIALAIQTQLPGTHWVHTNPWWTHGINEIWVVATGMIACSMHAVSNRPAPVTIVAALVVANLIGGSVAILAFDPVAAPRAIASLVVGVCVALSARGTFMWPARLNSTARWLVGMSSVILALVLFLRSYSTIAGSGTSHMSVVTASQIILILAICFCLCGFTMGGVLIANDRLRAELKSIASLDSLTGLYTRRAFFDLAESRLNAGSRRSRRLQQRAKQWGVLMLDIDHFKKINDTFGHPAGDRSIVQAAELLRGSVRMTDFAARYGGEEFIVFVEDASAEFLQALGARLNDQARKTYQGQTECPPYTLSVGGALIVGNELKDAIRRADAALYRAKREGRDRTVVDGQAIRGSSNESTTGLQPLREAAPA